MTRKRTRRPEARPDEILDAALAVFSEQGFAAARVEDVAKRAGLSKGAVYLYFDSKEAMLTALVRRVADRVAGAAGMLAEGGTAGGAEATLRAVLGFMGTQLADPKISAAPRLILAEAQRFPEIAALYRDEVIERGRALIAGLIDRGVAEGAFRDIDRDVALRACAGPMLAHMMLTTVFARPGETAPDPADFAGAIADLVLNGLKPRTGDAG